MIGGLTPQQIAAMSGGQMTPGYQPDIGLAGAGPQPIQSAIPQGGQQPSMQGAASPMMLMAQLLRQKHFGAPSSNTPIQSSPQAAQSGPQNWRDQPMYLGGGTAAGQTPNQMGGDWRSQPAFLPVDTPNPGGKFSFADPGGVLLHSLGLHSMGESVLPSLGLKQGLFGAKPK